jgi:hypothetical protein
MEKKAGITIATSAQLLERIDPVLGSIDFEGFDAPKRRNKKTDWQ